MAVDPGPHTGVAIRRQDGTVDTTMIHNDLDTLCELIMAVRPEVVIVERFATSGRISRYGLQTVEIVGMVKGLAWTIGARVVTHTPTMRYSQLPKAKRDIGKGQTQHQIDALAHLYTFEYMEAARARRR